MIASGRLISRPKSRPTSQPGHDGNCTQPITKPMAKRLVNAPSSAVVLSGKDIGSISPTSSAPKTRPAMSPRTTLDIIGGLSEPPRAHNIYAAILYLGSLDCRNGSPVDDNLSAVNIRSPVGDQDSNQFGYFFGTTGATDRNPAQRIHQPLSCGVEVCPRVGS